MNTKLLIPLSVGALGVIFYYGLNIAVPWDSVEAVKAAVFALCAGSLSLLVQSEVV
ncbi:MAG: hypothetical protein J07HQX50_00191 [Haloquadratum sp. J07HQX50]|jgi:hypothetical protein|nr:MAG: hypothetical protein J07HQX50_00191 [Haloquadratum sp. J07HQX50]